MPAVLFDLDGTLLDTAYLHTFAWWKALDGAGRPHPMADIHPLIGMGSSELLHELIGTDDEDISASHGRLFEELHPCIRRLPGSSELVQDVVARGGQAVVATSAKEKDLEALLVPLGCRELFDDVVHGEETERAKPAPDVFSVALERVAVGPDDAIAIGDSVWDVKAAGRAGVGCIGVCTGGINPTDLEGAGAVAVYRSCADLLGHWESSPLAALLGGKGG